MATCKNSIDGALRKIGVLASGRDATDQEYTDAMEALQGAYKTWISQGTFGSFRDVTVSNGCYTAFPGDHVYRLAGDSVELPGLIHTNEALTGDDYGRGFFPGQMPYHEGNITPPDGSVVKITDDDTQVTLTWVFEGQTKQWVCLERLELNDEAPLSERDPNGFKAYLAMILSEEFAMELGPIALRQAQQFTYNLALRPASYRITNRKDYC